MTEADGSGDWDPAGLCEDAFLAGPDRYAAWDGETPLIDVDDVFAKPFERILSEQQAAEPGSVDPGSDSLVTPSLVRPGYAFAGIEAGVLLLDPDGVAVGGYIGCDVAVAGPHRGLGLGPELILELALRRGGLPAWDLDAAAYSRAGEAAHRAAHALARDRAFLAGKRAALAQADAAASLPSP